jgi:hypothetical protein
VPTEILKSLPQLVLIIVRYNYDIANKFLLEECDKEEKVIWTGDAVV